MIRRHLSIVLLAALAAFAPSLVAAFPAEAGVGSPVLADCNSHDSLTKVYSVPELRNALATMPATMLEYTDCHDVIQRALTNAQAGHSNGGGSSSSGGSSVSTPVIVIIVVLVLAAATLGAIAIRRRREP